MTKADLIALAQQLRAENSVLRTQLEAARACNKRTARPTRPIEAIERLVARYPERRSFTDAEVRAEAACSA